MGQVPNLRVSLQPLLGMLQCFNHNGCQFMKGCFKLKQGMQEQEREAETAAMFKRKIIVVGSRPLMRRCPAAACWPPPRRLLLRRPGCHC